MAEKSLLEISLFQDIFPPPDQTALPVTFGLLISNILATSKSTQFTCQEIFQKRICHLMINIFLSKIMLNTDCFLFSEIFEINHCQIIFFMISQKNYISFQNRPHRRLSRTANACGKSCQIPPWKYFNKRFRTVAGESKRSQRGIQGLQ